jgi:hypothetical protein
VPRPSGPSKRERELKTELDKVTRLLCGVLRAVENEVGGSGCLVDEETQAWWEEHQKVDAARMEALKAQALKKLEPDEIEALGLVSKKVPARTRHK